MSPAQNVILALLLSAVLIVIAGDAWDDKITRFKPVKVAPK